MFFVHKREWSRGGSGYFRNFLVGILPPQVVVRRGYCLDYFARSFAAAPLAPIPCLNKKTECVHGLRLSFQRVRMEIRQFGAGAGTFRGRVFILPPNDRKPGGV